MPGSNSHFGLEQCGGSVAAAPGSEPALADAGGVSPARARSARRRCRRDAPRIREGRLAPRKGASTAIMRTAGCQKASEAVRRRVASPPRNPPCAGTRTADCAVPRSTFGPPARAGSAKPARDKRRRETTGAGAALRAVATVSGAAMTPNGRTSAGGAGAFTEGGATVDITKANRGLVERPMLAPRLEFRIADASDGLYGRGVRRSRAGRGARDMTQPIEGNRRIVSPRVVTPEAFDDGASGRRFAGMSGIGGSRPRGYSGAVLREDGTLPLRYDMIGGDAHREPAPNVATPIVDRFAWNFSLPHTVSRVPSWPDARYRLARRRGWARLALSL